MNGEVSQLTTMDAPSAEPKRWLSREVIDRVIDGMAAADLIGAMGDGESIKGPKMAGDAFNNAAARLGISNGTPATEHVRMSDFAYLAEKIGGAVNTESPLSSEQGA